MSRMLKKYTEQQLKEIIKSHYEWTKGLPNGKCADLQNSYLSGLDFSDFELTSNYLEDYPINNSTFEGLSNADFSGSKLCGTYLNGDEWTRYYLNNANFKDADLCGANLSFSELHGTSFENSKLVYASLRECNIENVNFKNANLFGADLSGAQIKYTYLEGVNLDCINLADARIESVYLKDCKIKYANLSRVNIENSSFDNVQIVKSSLAQAKLENVYLGLVFTPYTLMIGYKREFKK